MIATICLTAVLAAPAAGEAPLSPKPAALRALPAALELGELPAGSTSAPSVWLWNQSDAPLHLTSAKASCGCTKVVAFEPTTLAAGEATSVDLEVRVPEVAGKTKKVEVVFAAEGRAPLRVPVHLVSSPAEAVPVREPVRAPATASAIAPETASNLRWHVTPANLAGEPETEVEGSLWLLWDAPSEGAEVTALSAKPACGCTTLAASPSELVARQPLEIPFRMKLPKTAGAHRKSFKIGLGDGELAVVPLAVTVTAADAGLDA